MQFGAAASAQSTPHQQLQQQARNPGQELLWSEKYRPTSIATMCSPGTANRVKQWVIQWERTPGGPRDGDVTKRAALLSGPPGVGKTTAVYVIARELGYEVIEFNASDHRSAKSLRESVSDLVDNRIFKAAPSKQGSGTGANSFFNLGSNLSRTGGGGGLSAGAQFNYQQGALTMGKKFILLMDEVDGCDRGGAGEIIQLIRNSKCPIICTCNDRWVQKLRSLINHVEDFRFARPACNEVAAFIVRNVLPRESITVSERLLQDVIRQGGNDIRSVLNNLQVWTRTDKNISDQKLAAAALSATKNQDLNLFDAAEKFFTSAARSESAGADGGFNIDDQMRMYYDMDLIDLFVVENYLNFKPDRKDWTTQAAVASNSIAAADVLQRQIFSEQTWLAGSAAAFRASVYPCAAVRGHFTALTQGGGYQMTNQRTIRFPSWLGFNSTSTKFKRIASSVLHQGLDPVDGFSAGTGSDFAMDYAPVLLARLAEPVAIAAANEKKVKDSAATQQSTQQSSSGKSQQSQGGLFLDSQGCFGGAMNNNDLFFESGGADIPTPMNEADAKKAKAAAAEKTKAAIGETIKMFDTYHLQRDDWDSLQELVEFTKAREVNPFAGRLNFPKQVTGTTKAALTREFNKGTHLERGAAKSIAQKGNFDNTQRYNEDGGGDDDDDDDDDDDNDCAPRRKVAPKKTPAGKAGAGAASAAAPGKGKGKGKAAGKKASPAPKPKAKGKAAAGTRRGRDE